MSQHDLTIANQGFPAFRADLNSALQALGSTQSGTAAPSPTFANQLWYDTANNILKMRNEDNDAWISIATLDQSGDLVALLVANTVNSVGDSTISGLTVGKGGGAVASNTVLGNGALGNGSQSGGGNNAFGQYSLYANTSGSVNNAFGNETLYANTTGASASAFGHKALWSNTTGSNNSAFGFNALYSNTTASNNTAVGYQAAYSNQTGASITAVGYKALYAATGNNNTAVGKDCGVSTTTGTSNSFFGAFAAYANTTGASNVALGYEALQANTTASQNTAVGYQAGYSNTVSANCTYIGYQAGYNAQSGASEANNTFVGRLAGYGVTTGVSNTFFGQSAGYSMTTGSKNTIIGTYNGNQGGLDIRTADNYIVLSDGDGNPRGVFDGSGNFIVGGTSSIGKIGATQTGNSIGIRAQNDSASFSSVNIWSTLTGASNTNTTAILYEGYASGSATFRVYGNGNVVNTNNSYGSISDVKLKENITDATPKLEKLNQVRVVSYNLKENPNQKLIGVVAQELEQIFPSMVEEAPDRDADGNIIDTVTKTVKYSVFVPMLIKAVQELNAKLEAQALEIETLKGK